MDSQTFLTKADEWSAPSFWKNLAPDLHIDDMAFVNTARAFMIDDNSTRALQQLIKTEGYFQLPPPQWDVPMADLAAVVAKLDAAGIPVPFAFLFDEFWLLFVKLHHMIESLLGPGYLRLPDFWVWYVDPRRDDRGWAPHRDKAAVNALRPDGSPLSLTVWLPLTDATTLNGCIYMVPADRDRGYATPAGQEFQFDYQDVRALPAQAGSVLMWNQVVLHWGSHGSPREHRPRISAAFEFQAGDAPPFNEPLMQPGTLPNFQFRLALIAKQILQYRHMYPLSAEMQGVATTLLSRAPPGSLGR